MREYKPSEYDLEWTRRLIKSTNENAIWGWPDSGLIMQLRHSKKELAIIDIMPMGLTPERVTTNIIIARDVFKGLGWSVVLDFESSPLKGDQNDAD